ncbi:MAG: FAD-dependent oxidoreductase, partial [Bacillota bacterium]
MNYRVAVVGAGPGGLVLACELAGQGIRVTVYEKESFDEIGHNWSDAVEYSALKAAGLDMPELNGRRWKGTLVKDGPEEQGIFEKHAVPRLKVYSPGRKSYKEIDFEMITTDRRRLAQHLATEAEAAGAEIIYNHEGRELLYTENEQKGPAGVSVLGLTLKDLKNEELIAVDADLVVESSGFKSVLLSSLPRHTGLADPFKNNDFALVHREVYNYDPEV